MSLTSDLSESKKWLVWTAVIAITGIHLVLVVVTTHYYHQQTDRYQRLVKSNQFLIEQLNHYEVEQAYQTRLLRIEKWAKEHGMQITPSVEHKIIVDQ